MLRERKSEWPFIIYYIFLFFIVIGSLIYFFNDKDEFEPVQIETQEQYEDVEAYIDAQAVVKRYLKAPSTADFPSSSKASILRDGDHFVISSYVDSENSFGAKIRSDWTVEFTSVGDQIAIQSVIIGGVKYR